MTDKETKREDPMIAALIEERRGYVMRGLDDRVAEVDKALKSYGYDAKAAARKAGGAGKAPQRTTEDTTPHDERE